MKWAGNMARMEEKTNAYGFFFEGGGSEGTTPLLNTSIYMGEYLIGCNLGGL